MVDMSGLNGQSGRGAKRRSVRRGRLAGETMYVQYSYVQKDLLCLCCWQQADKLHAPDLARC
jgi:hypothetical protein